MSNVSMCDGPPNWCRKMMCFARAAHAAGSSAARSRSAGSGPRSPPSRPAAGSAARGGRSTSEVGAPWFMGRSFRLRQPIRSMPEQEFLAIDQGPGHVFPRLAAVRAPAHVGEDGSPFGGGRARGRGRPGTARRGSPRRAPCRRAAGRSGCRRPPAAPDRLAVDELERLRQRRRLGPLALAGQQPVGLAEDLEERAAHPRARQLAARRPAGAASGTARACPAPGRSRRAGPPPAGAGPRRGRSCLVVGVGRVGLRAELVGLRLHDQADQRPEPHPARRPAAVRASSSAGLDGGFESRKSSTGLDDAPAHQVEPDAVGHVPGELAVVAGEPVGQVVEGAAGSSAERAWARAGALGSIMRRCGAGPSRAGPTGR